MVRAGGSLVRTGGELALPICCPMASASRPSASAVEQSEEKKILITYSDIMRPAARYNHEFRIIIIILCKAELNGILDVSQRSNLMTRYGFIPSRGRSSKSWQFGKSGAPGVRTSCWRISRSCPTGTACCCRPCCVTPWPDTRSCNRVSRLLLRPPARVTAFPPVWCD